MDKDKPPPIDPRLVEWLRKKFAYRIPCENGSERRDCIEAGREELIRTLETWQKKQEDQAYGHV